MDTFTVDIRVVGAGGAGLRAAIAAAEFILPKIESIPEESRGRRPPQGLSSQDESARVAGWRHVLLEIGFRMAVGRELPQWVIFDRSTVVLTGFGNNRIE